MGWFRHGLLASLAGRLTRCSAGFVIGSGRSGRGKNARPVSHEDFSSEGNPARGIAFGDSCDLLCVQVFLVSCCDLFRFQLQGAVLDTDFVMRYQAFLDFGEDLL